MSSPSKPLMILIAGPYGAGDDPALMEKNLRTLEFVALPRWAFRSPYYLLTVPITLVELAETVKFSGVTTDISVMPALAAVKSTEP